MIYQMSQDIESNLKGRKYPVEITYGPERLKRSGCGSYEIVMNRDDESGDAVHPVQASRSNPKMWAKRALGVVATFYVASPVSGAMISDHQRDCDALVDAFLVEVIAWGEASKAGAIDFGESRYLNASEHNGSEYFGDVVYRLRFEVPRALLERDYNGDARAVGAPTTVSNQSFARVDGGAREEI
jgi:hypothetical protein